MLAALLLLLRGASVETAISAARALFQISLEHSQQMQQQPALMHGLQAVMLQQADCYNNAPAADADAAAAKDEVVEWCVCVLRVMAAQPLLRAAIGEQGGVQLMLRIACTYTQLMRHNGNSVRWDIVNQSFATLWNLSVLRQNAVCMHEGGVWLLLAQAQAHVPDMEFVNGLSTSLHTHGLQAVGREGNTRTSRSQSI